MNTLKIKLSSLHAGMIFFFITVILMAVACYKIGVPDYEDLLESAVILTKAEVLPENEGKLVILIGKPKLTKSYHDKEYYQQFDSPYVRRRVEQSMGRDRSGEKWRTESDRLFIGGAKVGNFVLDGRLISCFPQNSSHTLNLPNGKRITYNYANFSAPMQKFTIIGKQKGNTLFVEDRIKLGCVFNKKYNKKQILEKSMENGKTYRTTAVYFLVCGIFIGAVSWPFFAAKIKSIYS